MVQFLFKGFEIRTTNQSRRCNKRNNLIGCFFFPKLSMVYMEIGPKNQPLVNNQFTKILKRLKCGR